MKNKTTHPMCPGVIKYPLMLTKKEWLERHVENAFEAMWAANYGVDKKDEKKSLKETLKLIRKQ